MPVEHTPRPNATPHDAARIAREVFAVVGQPQELPSERDRNFRIREADGRSWILRIANAAEDPARLQMQDLALAHLHTHAPQVRVPRVRSPLAGGLATDEVGGGTHLVRMLSWLPGRPMVDVRPHSAELLTDLGRSVGGIDAALVAFTHPAGQLDFKWDLRNGLDVVDECLGDVDDASRRELVTRSLARLRERWPALDDLRRSVIHNDANDHNVIVGDTVEGALVSGVIDFGDMLETWTIGGLAIACAYGMLDKRAPLDAAASITRGYHAALPIEDDEVDALADLIRLRLCVSVTNSARERRHEPDNAYLAVTEAPAWRLLERLDTVPVGLDTAVLRRACGRAASPSTPGVIAWLDSNATMMTAAIDGDLSTAPRVDLSASSSFLAEIGDDVDVATLTRGIESIDPNVVLGHYDEARVVYATDAFLEPREEMVERRTVHLGIDVFVPAGTPIRAPLDGVVSGVEDNDAPLEYGPTLMLRHEPEPGLVFFTLYGHLGRDVLDGLQAGQRVERGDVIASVGSAEVNGGWPPHLHLQLIVDPLGRAGEFPGVAAPGRRDVWLDLSPDPARLLGLEPGSVRASAPDAGEIMSDRAAHLGPTLSVAYRRPLTIVRGRGTRLIDVDGQPYLDCVNNVCHVGHCHPHVVDAGRRQMAVLNTNTRYLHPTIAAYARRLAATLPDGLDVCYFVCSGSEANELALRLARAKTGARDIIALEAGYHGNTQGLVEISSYKFEGPGGFDPPGHVHVAPLPDVYRGPYRRDHDDPGRASAARVGELVQRAGSPAAFIVEAMPGCGGQIILPDGYLDAAFEHVRGAGGVCIADEVQTGFGRAGSHFWAFQTQGVTPDIVTMGKPIGNGHPLAAVVTTREIAQAFDTGMEYFNTFGGNPVSCAIGMAVLDVIEREGLQDNAERTGAYLLDRLRELQTRHPLIGDVRGRGLYIGAELVRDRGTLEPAADEASYVIERMRGRGVLLSTDGPLHNVLKIKPPIVFSREDADRLCDELDVVLGASCLTG